MNETKSGRILQLVAVCVKKELTPSQTGFADFIIRLSASYFQCDKRTSRSYIDTLIQAFRFDKWKSLVQQNLYLSEEEKVGWMTRHL